MPRMFIYRHKYKSRKDLPSINPNNFPLNAQALTTPIFNYEFKYTADNIYLYNHI